MYITYRNNIEACDEKIAKLLGDFEAQVDIKLKPLPAHPGPSRKRWTKRTGDFRFEVRTEAYKLFGLDVNRIPGLNELAVPIFSEVGRDLEARFQLPAQADVRACSLEVKSWMPTRPLTREGRADREETDKHLFGPPASYRNKIALRTVSVM